MSKNTGSTQALRSTAIRPSMKKMHC